MASAEASGLAIDASGSVYLAETSACRVAKVATGFPPVVSALAGTGIQGFSGDGGPALNAQLPSPAGPAFDANGNLYFGDGDRVRVVDSAGVIKTIAGNNTADNLAVFSGDGFPAVGAALSAPTTARVDGKGNLYIADTADNRIRKVDASGTISTVVGKGVAGLSGDGGPATMAEISAPNHVLPDGAGNIYIAGSGN